MSSDERRGQRRLCSAPLPPCPSSPARSPFRRTHPPHPASNPRFRRLATFPLPDLKRSCTSPPRHLLRAFPTHPVAHASGRVCAVVWGRRALRALACPHSLRSSLTPGPAFDRSDTRRLVLFDAKYTMDQDIIAGLSV